MTKEEKKKSPDLSGPWRDLLGRNRKVRVLAVQLSIEEHDPAYGRARVYGTKMGVYDLSKHPNGDELWKGELGGLAWDLEADVDAEWGEIEALDDEAGG